MPWVGAGKEPGSGGGRSRPLHDDKARMRPRAPRGAPREWGDARPDAAVLVLLWGRPPRVLVERKTCPRPGWAWSCDAALPGGRIEEGETPVEAALREAWEEAWVHPGLVRVLGSLPLSATKRGGILVEPVLAEPRGPVCPMPVSEEVDQVFWLPLDLLDREPGWVEHPVRGERVLGYRLPGGAVLWGLTLRILRVVRRLYLDSEGPKLL